MKVAVLDSCSSYKCAKLLENSKTEDLFSIIKLDLLLKICILLVVISVIIIGLAVRLFEIS
ncbi:hypothetical protein Pint_33145 [Pistacia integerrima]|uniref:Uncharacterized protein n=1 Tax=Pistacia integerrima TaxID=434235 RepID=A0ACC0X499_9ROSI|nr:hypothetical protein Pint_33145 [Pistacia integerrima]